MNATLLPRVRTFLGQNPIPHWIGGKGHAVGSRFPVIDPATGEPLAETSFGGGPEIELAVEAAAAAFPAWAAMEPGARGACLQRWADRMQEQAAELAQLESLDVGKAITAAEAFDIPFGLEGLRYFATLAGQSSYETPLALAGIEARVHRAPYGVCGFIFPWNFPFDLFIWGVAPALAAGNTVVVKPSEVTPLSTLYAAQLATEAGLPAGVLNVVVGDGPGAGAALAAHRKVRRMSFTGSPEAGSRVAEVCGRRIVPCKLELGGKGAAVIFPDADPVDTAQKLVAALTLNTGQVCCTATRWIVHRDVADRFTEAAVSALEKVKIGPGQDRSTEMGPVVNENQRRRVEGYFEKGKKEGARAVLAPRSGPAKGFFVTPWVLEGGPENVCFREEVFGPAAYVTRFGDETEALDLVHRVDYGLANSVWTADLSRAVRVAKKMEVGNAWINAHNVFAYGLPYG
ncbi:MAG: aldehyde dehydrogenase, partial [Verrucomicrobia bacterium]|nr:aldehyde dehydrogenase [Verrucomicrobiota bacterium]